MIKKLSFLIALTFTIIGFGQSNNLSPYSYFGIGEVNQQMTVASSSMGGTNIFQNSISELNFTNPAALHTLKFTTFSIAGNMKLLKIDNGSINQNTSNTGLTSLALGIPLGNNGGALIGLQPNSSVGYSITKEGKEGDEITKKTNFNGDGGTNRFFGSIGYQVLKGLSLGIEGEVLFGNVNHNIIHVEKDVSYNTKYQTISNLSGGSLKLGAQYHYKLKNELQLQLGASLKLKNKLKVNSEEYLYSFLYGASGAEVSKDTLSTTMDIKGEITKPTTIALGAGLGEKNKWNLGFEYESQSAISIDQSIFQNNKVHYAAKSRYSLGGYYLPKINSITSYWQRVIYRAGIKYENTGLEVNGTENSGEFTPINDFGISFGLGLPIGNQLSQVNLGLEYGNRGNTNNELIKENYFNLRLSFNLTDKWFRKNKIN